MPEPWFTSSDTSGEVVLIRRENSWYVKSPDPDSEVKCIVQDDTELDPKNSPVKLYGNSTKYIQGTGDKSDFLYFEPEESTNTLENDKDSGEIREQSGRTNSLSSMPQCDLSDLNGSGDYVDLEAVVASISWVKKETDHVPDIKGKLIDESTNEAVTFVVNDGVSHPYLEEGARFKFSGVKDHYYSKESEIQVMINDKTDFTEKSKQTLNPSVLIERLTEATTTDRVWYDPQMLREWVHGYHRFYLKNKCGGSDNTDTQYFRCKNLTTHIQPVKFHDKSVEIKSVETEKQNYKIGLLDRNAVIISADPEHFWK